MKETVILVNEQGCDVGLAEKLKAHQQGLLHRAFSVFVFRKYSAVVELLLQRRQIDKYHSGGLWTNTCCSHPRPGETVLEGAHRRLKEELGIETFLEEVGTFCYCAEVGNGLVEHEWDHVLIGEIGDEIIQPNQNEMEAVAWVELQALKEDLKKYPEKYTVWFEQALDLAIGSDLFQISISCSSGQK